MKTANSFIVVLLSMMLAAGCAKKRPERTSVFSGVRNGETVKIDTLDDKWLSFEAESFQASGENFGAEEVEIAEDVDFINDLPYVNFNTESELLGDDLRVKARVGAEYQIWQKLDGNFLKIYLVGEKLDIPFEAWTYSKAMEDGRLAMPLVGYPVTYVRLLNAENSQGKQTSFVSEDSLLKPEDFHKATHISPAWGSRTPFASTDKKDILPVELFFSKETQEAKSWMFSGYHEISGYTPGKSYIQGTYHRSGANNGARNARFAFIPEIKMVKRSDSFFLTADYGQTHSFVERASEEYKELDANYVGKLPVSKYVSYRNITDVAGDALGEEETNTNASSFENADYVSFDFLGFETWSRTTDDAVFEKLIIGKDMISWVLKEESKRLRFNLWSKEASDKAWGSSPNPRDSYESDKAYFNLFTLGRDVDLDDVSQRYILNNDVDGYISRYAHGAKVEIRPTGALANEAWVEEVLRRATFVYNKIYKKAYEGYEVDELGNSVEAPQFSYSSDPVDFGDPRYLKLNFSSLLYSNSGGWSGPFTEPKSGQIVGGSNYIVAAADLGYQESFVLTYIDGVLGKGSGTVLINPSVRGQFVEVPAESAPSSQQISGDPNAVINQGSLQLGLIDHRLNYVLENFGNWDFNTSPINGDQNLLQIEMPNFQNSQVGVLPLVQSNKSSIQGGFGFSYSSGFLANYGYSSSQAVGTTSFDDFYSNALNLYRENNQNTSSLQSIVDDLAYAEMNNPYKDFSPDRHKLITNLCSSLSTKLNDFKSRLDQRNTPTISSLPVYEIFNDEIKGCATKLAVERMSMTAVHEMLHGSGLSHNMHGSSDEDNFLSEEFIKDVYGLEVEDLPGQVFWKTSSIMDYGNSAVVQSYLAGPYDLAAIRFIQTGRFENNQGGMTSVLDVSQDSEGNSVVKAKSINSAVSETKIGRKIYEVCDDQDIIWGRSVLAGGVRLNEDPMCDYSDSGATPVEKAENIIKSIEYTKAIATVTRDTEAYSQGYFDYIMGGNIQRLREIYSFWRTLLARQVGSPENAYLEEFDSAEDYSRFLRVVSENGSEAQVKLFKEYYQARNLIFNFLLEEAFSLNHYCVVEYMPVNRADGQPLAREPLKEVVEFSKIKQLIQLNIDDDDELFVGGCLDAQAQSVIRTYITSKKSYLIDRSTQGLSITKIEEAGNPLQGYRYSHNIIRSNSGLDAVGFSNYRAMAFTAITRREITSFEGRGSGLYPNMIDEADLRLIVRARLEDRVNNGVRLNSRGAFGVGLIMPATQKEDVETFTKLQSAIEESGESLGSLLDLGGHESVIEGLEKYDPMVISMLVPKMKEIAFEGCYNNSDSEVIYGGIINPAFLRFSEEDNLIGYYATMYRNAISVPNDRDASLERAKDFRVELISSYQRDYYVRNNAGIKFMDLGNYFVYPYEGASFVEDSINKFEEISAGQEAKLVNPEKIYEILRRHGRELFTLHSSDEVTSPAYINQTVAEFRGKLDGLFDEVNKAYSRFLNEADESEGVQLNASELRLISGLATQKFGGFGNLPIVDIDTDGNPATAKRPVSYFASAGLVETIKTQLTQMGELDEYAPEAMVSARAAMIEALGDLSKAIENYESLSLSEALDMEAGANREGLLNANENFKCAVPESVRGNIDAIEFVTSRREVYRAKIFTYEDLRSTVLGASSQHNLTVLGAQNDKEEADAQKNMLRNMISSFLMLQRF